MAAARSKKLVQSSLLSWRVPPVHALTVEDIASASGSASGSESASAFDVLANAPELASNADAQADPHKEAYAAIAAEIAEAKDALDDIAPADYTQMSRELDVYAGLRRTMRRFGAPVATNATLKIFEMLNALPIVAASGPLAAGANGIRAFCNAELPGAFLIGINQFARQLPAALDWVASSYVPRVRSAGADATILDDQYGLLAGNPDRWLVSAAPASAAPASAAVMQEQYNGDMTDPAMVEAAADMVRARFVGPTGRGASLYTSDAGIDVSADYNGQEASTAVLNFGQVLCGLLALAPGGSLVTKQYTFTLPLNRQLLIVLAASFEALLVVKPRTSRPANSEIYIVGIGFRGLAPGVGAALLRRLAAAKAGSAHILRAGVLAAPDTDSALLRIARDLARNQVTFLREITRVYASRGAHDAGAAARTFVGAAARSAERSWLEANPLARLPAAYQLKTAKL